jgi:hypothetical protein
LDPDRAAGILTQGAFLAAHSSSNETSPVRRGKFVRERLLCGEVAPPPPGVDVTPPESTPGQTPMSMAIRTVPIFSTGSGDSAVQAHRDPALRKSCPSLVLQGS